MPWQDSDFYSYFSDQDKAKRLVDARHTFGTFVNAQASGYLGVLMPEPGTVFDEEYVDKALQRLDDQYETEWRNRGRGRSLPHFNNMQDLQRIALVQRLRKDLRSG